MLFTGEYELTIDPKNRLSIPSVVRGKMEAEGQPGSFYLVPGDFRGSLNLYPERQFEADALARHAVIKPGIGKKALQAVFYASVTPLDWDKQGRLLLPQKRLEKAKIGRQVILAGAEDHLILWDRPEYVRFMEDHEAKYSVEYELELERSKNAQLSGQAS